MTLTAERHRAITAPLEDVLRLITQARNATELEACRKATNAAWFSLHAAQEAIRDAETATRREALAKIGEAA